MTPHEFTDLHAALRQLQADGFAGGAALATLVQTRGPVFRRAGARMLVFGDGRVVRGLSAGCPEADIIERSREVIASGQARLLCYDREHGYDTLLELGCGGEMEILLTPLRNDADLRFSEAVAESLNSRQEGLLATLFARDGRALPRPRHLVCCGQTLLDDLDDSELSDALRSLQPTAAGPQQISTRAGSARLLIEPLRPPLRLALIGLHSTSLALARLARGLGWPVCLIDHRDDRADTPLADGLPVLHAAPSQLGERFRCDARTAVVVMTHNLERDIDYLRALSAQPLAYLGALGSRSRAGRMREALGASAERLHAPAGLDIGSETPEEIALAIAAEIQATVSGHRGGSLQAGEGPIH